MKHQLEQFIPKKQKTRNCAARLEEDLMDRVDKYLEKKQIKLKDFVRAAILLALSQEDKKKAG